MAVELIEHNPSLKAPLMRLLGLCDASPDAVRAEVEAQAASGWQAAWRLSPSACLDILVRNEALEQTILVDGQRYPGSFNDLQTDPEVPDDADVVAVLAVTPLGQRILADYDPAFTLAALLGNKPDYEDVFKAALAACNTQEGCALFDLEAAIKAFPQLQPDPGTGQTKVYPQYFIDALETAGGIAWDGAWRTTEAGQAAIA